MDVERRENILGWVTRGGESEYGIGLGVALEVGSVLMFIMLQHVSALIKGYHWPL